MKRMKMWNTVGYDLRIPAALKGKYYDGELTGDQVFFLAEIHALAQYGERSHPKHGCFPTNAALAENEGISLPRLRAKLYELVDLGLLVVTQKRGVRYIRTIWHDAENSRIRRAKRKKVFKVVRR